jgi:CRISPR system Cascade subunit CasD
MANTLFLRLEGAMQTWGERGQWDVRDTALEPTKSGVVGLLACALGWNTDDQLRQLSRYIRMGVRCDRPGTRIRDYHTIGGGYKNAQEGGLLSADGEVKTITKGKDKGKPQTAQSWRSYLCDASFLVAVQSDDVRLITELAEAAKNPRWPIFLGRKSCVPTRPPFDGIDDYPSLEAALEQHPARLLDRIQAQRIAKRPRIVVECQAGEGVRHRDQIVSRSFRLFEPRHSREYLPHNEITIEYIEPGG